MNARTGDSAEKDAVQNLARTARAVAATLREYRYFGLADMLDEAATPVSRPGTPRAVRAVVEAESERKFCPACGRPDVIVGLDSVLLETRPTVRRHACGVGGPGSGEIECQHEWLDRPESDSRECLVCGTEVAG